MYDLAHISTSHIKQQQQRNKKTSPTTKKNKKNKANKNTKKQTDKHTHSKQGHIKHKNRTIQYITK